MFFLKIEEFYELSLTWWFFHDVRKVTSLSFQLASKNKFLPISTCGYRNDSTGGCLSNELVINTSRHLNNVLDFDPDQALIHVQAGTSLNTINLIAKEHSLSLPLSLYRRNY